MELLVAAQMWGAFNVGYCVFILLHGTLISSNGLVYTNEKDNPKLF